jgi:hypothetical protein
MDKSIALSKLRSWRSRILADGVAMALCFGILVAPAMAQSVPAPNSRDPDSVWFACSASPQGSCAEVLVRAIREARLKIVVETADLGPRAVAHALCSDVRRGIDVEIVQTPACEAEGANQGRGPPAAQCDPNYRIDSPQTMVIDRKVVVQSFFRPPPVSAAPRPIDHLLMNMNPISAVAYADSLESRSHPLEAQICRSSQ